MTKTVDTVGELIEVLERFDEDRLVRVHDDDRLFRPHIIDRDECVSL